MIFACAIFGCISVGSVSAQEADSRLDAKQRFFENEIRPALIEHCAECHWSDTEASGGLLLDSKHGWQQGGDLGPAIIPGDPDSSLLIQAIEYSKPDLEMPPDGKLNTETITLFRRWVLDGAIDPREPARPEPDASAEPSKQGLTVDRAQEHWAYRPLANQAVARSRTDASAIVDQLINQRIEENKLVVAAPASRSQLIRRLTFDLHGLPPTPDEIQAFMADRSPTAYEQLVDRLLASPRFGEHFARRWMDVVRYADSITLRGFILKQAWRYRDYLISAFATDRPFDQMIRDQIAGDLLPVADLTETQLRAIATGFLALGNSNLEDQDKTKLEFDHLDEQVETIGRAFLAQTIGCARCHDHKFDPIPTRDYYALAGIFRSTTPLEHANLSKWIEKPLPLSKTMESHYQDVQRQIKDLTQQVNALKDADQIADDKHPRVIQLEPLPGVVVDDEQATLIGSWTKSNFIPGYVGEGYQHDSGTKTDIKSATFDPIDLPSGRYKVRMSYTDHPNRATNVQVNVFSANESKAITVNQRQAPADDGVWLTLGIFPFEKDGQHFVIVSNENANGTVVVDAIQFLPVEENELATIEAIDPPAVADSADAENRKQQREALKREISQLKSVLDQRPKYLTIAESEPKQSIAIRIRGNVHQEGTAVPRGFLTAVGPASDYARRIPSDQSGRSELAQWIADPENPLTARVYANRIWSWLMGDGIVASENNFGTTGTSPTHPALLDHLANELIRNEWSTKHLVRTIVQSQAYRRSISDHDVNRQADPQNRFYASGRLKRVPVESMRDAILSISGELNHDRFGSEIRPGTKSDYDYQHDSLRRSVYLPVFRNSLPQLFETFDFADSSVSVGQRARSTVAPQSLAMMNHPWVIQRATTAAQRILRDEHRNGIDQLINRTYLLTIGRLPSDDEFDVCRQFLEFDSSVQLELKLADLIQSLFASIDFRYLE